MKKFRCIQCGAPLNPEYGDQKIQCSYCWTENLISWEDETEAATQKIESEVKKNNFIEDPELEDEVKVLETGASKEKASKKASEETLKGVPKVTGKDRGKIVLFRNYLLVAIVAIFAVTFFGKTTPVKADTGNEVRTVPAAAKKLEGKHYMDVVDYFRDCGFENIEVEEEYDLVWDVMNQDEKVDEISIEGCTNFKKNATFYKDARIIIYYHSHNN